MSFSGLEGQPRAAEILKGAFTRGRVAHGQLFLGPDETVLKRAALAFVKALFCDKRGGEPCGTCSACSRVDRGLHPDLNVVAPAEDARGIKVEEIRGVIAKAGLRPFEAPAKAFLIERAGTMNDIAQNALLKTLEEPEAGTYFILLSGSAEGLLPTLRSRLQTVNFAPEKGSAEADPAADEIARKILEFLLYRRNSADPYADAPEFPRAERLSVARALDQVAGYFRDVLVLRAGAGDILGDDCRDRGEKEGVARRLDEDAIVEHIELLGVAKERIAGTINLKLALSALWDGIAA